MNKPAMYHDEFYKNTMTIARQQATIKELVMALKVSLSDMDSQSIIAISLQALAHAEENGYAK